MSMDELMNFRTTYLRAIPEAWTYPDFRNALFADAVKALRIRFGYVWPWGDVCDLKILNSEHKFEWLDDEWVWSPVLLEGLTLQVPLRPVMNPDQAEIPKEQQAMALADYYRQYSALFSDTWGKIPGAGSAKPPRPSKRDLESDISTSAGVSGPDSAPPIGGFIPADEEFAAFEVALLGAIAKAWRDPSFREMLQLDAKAALATIRGYELPWNMTVRVADDEQAYWQPPSHDGRGLRKDDSHWCHDKHNVLQLFLPSKPHEILSEPLALAAYNATGAEYPFTCTC